MTKAESDIIALSPARRMMQFLWPAPHIAQALYVVAKLGIADLIKDGPVSAEQLACKTATNGRALYRVARALTGIGVFEEDEQGRFSNTALSETLRSDHPESIRASAIMMGAPFLWRPWGDLLNSVTTGKPAFDRLFGQPFFAYLGTHPDDAAVFNAAMTAGASATSASVAEAYDFSGFDSVVDVGGGHGALIKDILRKNPNLHGILFDLAEVVSGAADILTDPEIRGRIEVIGGDFFREIPPASMYMIKGVLHDWSDADALRILASCRRAIKPGGRLLIIESMLKPSNQPDPGKFMDLMMLILVNGRERSQSDFLALFQQAGFSLTRTIPTSGPYTLVEAQPI
ncbi:MAG TPA: methyltransferase [Blastocatellia bacterium]